MENTDEQHPHGISPGLTSITATAVVWLELQQKRFGLIRVSQLSFIMGHYGAFGDILPFSTPTPWNVITPSDVLLICLHNMA